MVTCLKCNSKFDDLESWEEHNESCGAYGYNVSRKIVKKSNIKVESKLNGVPVEPQLHQSDKPSSDKAGKLADVMGAEKPAKKVKAKKAKK